MDPYIDDKQNTEQFKSIYIYTIRQRTLEKRETQSGVYVIGTTAGRELKVSTALPVASIYTQTHGWGRQTAVYIVEKRVEGGRSRRSSLVILSRVSTDRDDGLCEVWSSFFSGGKY